MNVLHERAKLEVGTHKYGKMQELDGGRAEFLEPVISPKVLISMWMW